MKILSKQRNSRMCMICGLDNEYGVNAPFYNMEDGSVMEIFFHGITMLQLEAGWWQI